MVLRDIARTILAGLIFAAATPALAGNLQVSPVGLDLPARQAAATLTLRNNDDQPMTVQVRVFRWSQAGGEDRLTPTEDVVVSPPIGPIDAHGERIVRVVRVGPASETEASYRLMVDELPPPPDPNNRRVRLLMRHSIPLFFAAAGPSAANVSWSTAVAQGVLTLDARNDGSRHLRLSGLKIVDSAGDVLTERSGLLGYILAGAEMSWTLPFQGAGPRRPAHLSAEGDTGTVDVALAAEP